MKLDALKHQGKRTAPTSAQVGQRLKTSVEKIAEKIGESKTQVQRYIRLTHLIPQLVQLVDERQIAFSPAVELSFLTQQGQIALQDAMDSEQARPSLSQAQRLRKLSESGSLNITLKRNILAEEKVNGEEGGNGLYRLPRLLSPENNGSADPQGSHQVSDNLAQTTTVEENLGGSLSRMMKYPA